MRTFSINNPRFTWYKEGDTYYALRQGIAYHIKNHKVIDSSGHYDSGEFSKRYPNAVRIPKPLAESEVILNYLGYNKNFTKPITVNQILRSAGHNPYEFEEVDLSKI